MNKASEASGGSFDQPAPTLKESEGLNSSERYTPGRSCCWSSGRRWGLNSCCFSPPLQALSAKTASATSSPSLRACLTILLWGYIRYSSFPYATIVAYPYEAEERIPQMQYLLLERV